nr:WD domain, G-beta repeat [uncultured bacterium]
MAPGPQTAKQAGLFDGLKGLINQLSAGSSQQTKQIKAHTQGITRIAVSHNGTRMISVGLDMKLRLWDLTSLREIASFDVYTDRMSTMGFSPEGKMLYANASPQATLGKGSGTFYMWSVLNGQKLLKLDGTQDSAIFSPNGKMIAYADRNSNVVLIDPKTGRHKFGLRGHRSNITKILYTPDSQFIIASAKNGAIVMWNAQTGREACRFVGHTDAVTDITLLDENRLISVSLDGTFRIWDVASGHQVLYGSQLGRTSNIRLVTTNSHDQFLTVESGEIRRWSVDGRELNKYTYKYPHQMATIDISKDGMRALIAYTSDPTLYWVDLNSGQELNRLEAPGTSVYTAQYFQKGDIAIVGMGDGTIQFWPLVKKED